MTATGGMAGVTAEADGMDAAMAGIVADFDARMCCRFCRRISQAGSSETLVYPGLPALQSIKVKFFQ